MNFDAVIFDFDGTVADTGEGVRNAIRYSLNEYNMPIYEDRLNEFLGPPLYLTYESMYGISPELANDLVDTYRVYYSETGVHELVAKEGMLELAAALKAEGVRLAIASSKPLVFLETGVHDIGADELYEEVVGPDLKNHEANKAYLVRTACERLGIEPSKRVAMVGDRSYDIIGANEVGVTSIGIEFGFGQREEFLENNADYIATTFEDLKNILL
ncbi:MAG: HAD hydrolase-like protein [Clostridia bacterium]|nr:HAD hydrolase-like protein [Clostridia bacterium]